MAFTIEISNEHCDKCDKPGTDGNPVIRLYERSRHEQHTIFIHLACFTSHVFRLMKSSLELDDSTVIAGVGGTKASVKDGL